METTSIKGARSSNAALSVASRALKTFKLLRKGRGLQSKEFDVFNAPILAYIHENPSELLSGRRQTGRIPLISVTSVYR